MKRDNYYFAKDLLFIAIVMSLAISGERIELLPILIVGLICASLIVYQYYAEAETEVNKDED